MGSYIKVAMVSDFENGVKKKVSAGGQEILVAKVNDSFYAINSRCPHMGGDLSLGILEGTVISCPRHGSQFDVRNGQNVRWLKGAGLAYSLGKFVKGSRDVKSYPVKVDGQDIAIEI
jgi:3-phenylpropionate/trans-cinnamate dioxygenase ferredoxin component